MRKLDRKALSLVAFLAVAALFATAGVLAAQGEAVPRVTGKVVLWNGDRLDLKAADGKTHKVAVNKDTERSGEIKEGAELTVEYHRKVGGFIIALKVRPALEGEAAAPAAAASATAASPGPSTLTGKVFTWTDAALVVSTDQGNVTFFLSPKTEYRVKSLDAGLRVTVEYREEPDHAKSATRVSAAPAEEPQQQPQPKEKEKENPPKRKRDPR